MQVLQGIWIICIRFMALVLSHTRTHVWHDFCFLLNQTKHYKQDEELRHPLYPVPFLKHPLLWTWKESDFVVAFAVIPHVALIRTPSMHRSSSLPPRSLGMCPQARFEGVTKRQLIYLPTKESHLTFPPAQIQSPLGWNYILIWYTNKIPFFLLPEIKWSALARWVGCGMSLERSVSRGQWRHTAGGMKAALFRTLTEVLPCKTMWKTLDASRLTLLSFRLSQMFHCEDIFPILYTKDFLPQTGLKYGSPICSILKRACRVWAR